MTYSVYNKLIHDDKQKEKNKKYEFLSYIFTQIGC